MKGKMLFDALGGIADKYIAEAEVLPKKQSAFPRKRAAILIAAALVLLLSLGVYAASQNWHKALADYLKAGDEQMTELSGAVAMPELSVTDAGVTVTVKQTLADQHGVYVVYEVVAPEEFVFEDDMMWDWESISHEPSQPGSSHLSGSRVLEQEGNRRTILCWIEGKEMEDGRIGLYLENLCRFSPDFEHPLLIEGKWFLEWDFEFSDCSVLLCKSKANDANGEVIIEELSISPIAVYIRVRDTQHEKNMRPCITFKDGSIIDLWEKKDVSVLHEGETYSIYYMFDELISLEDVASVRSGDLLFTLE